MAVCQITESFLRPMRGLTLGRALGAPDLRRIEPVETVGPKARMDRVAVDNAHAWLPERDGRRKCGAGGESEDERG